MNTSSPTYYTPTVNGSEEGIPLSLIETNNSIKLDTSLEWSKDNDENESVILNKAEYEQMQAELSLNKTMMEDFKRRERESNKMLRNYDRTLTYMLGKNGQRSDTIPQGHMKNEVEDNESEEMSRLRNSEQRLKNHVQALKKDLFISEDRAEAYKQIAKEKIDVLTKELGAVKALYEEEKRRAGILNDKLTRLERIFENRCEESVELVEYCKYLLG